MAASPVLTYRAQIQEQHQETPAATPAAAPAATPAAAPAPAEGSSATASPVDSTLPPKATVYETLSDDDKIIEDLRREHAEKELAPEKQDPDPEKPARKTKKGKTDGQDDSKDDAADRGGKGKGKEAAIVKYGTPGEAITAITAAIEKGDPKALARALGKPEGFLDVSDAKWMAFREQQNALRTRDREVTAREHKYNENVAAVRKEYGAAVQAAKAYKEGKYDQFVTLVKELTGESYDVAQSKVIKGEVALSPEVKALREEIRQLRAEDEKRRSDEKKAKDESDAREQQKQAFERAVKAVTEELAGHRVAKLPNFQRLVLQRVRESWDPEQETCTMSFDEAADAIIEERDAEAEALGFVRKPPTPNGRGTDTLQLPPSVPPRSQAADARVPEGEPWMTERIDDDAIIESIKRDIKAGRLKLQ